MIEEPNISVDKKSNEENMQAMKAWASQIIENMQYMSNRIDSLEQLVASLKESEGR